VLDTLLASIPPDARLHELTHLATGSWRATIVQGWNMTHPAYGPTPAKALAEAINSLECGDFINLTPIQTAKSDILTTLGLTKPILRRL
jgi:hypothetical protein